MMSITYHPDRRNETLHDLSLLHIHGESIHKIETLGTIYINHTKRVNVFRRFNSAYEILLESDDHTIHFHKNIRVVDSLHQLLGYEMDYLDVMKVFSYKHHGALITPEEFHLSTLHWSELHYTWGGVSLYMESRSQQWASPLASPVRVEEQEDEVYQEESGESEEEAFASPVASRPEVPMAPMKQAQPAMNGTPSARRCLSDRFTALLQKRTFSETEESESDSESDSEVSQEECCTVLRSGMKYPRNLY